MQKQVRVSPSFIALAGMALFAAVAFAQPTLAPTQTTPEKLCSVDTAVSFRTDTVVTTSDENGFYSIFNGKDFTGWWQNCISSHSTDKSNGAIWRVDSVRKAIYAMSRSGSGGLLSTHKRYAHYELMFEWWPQYGNDGGVFNRYAITSSSNVASNQMVLDYLGASGILSYYSEANFPGGRNGRPWSYNSVSTGSIPGSGGGAGTGGTADINNWTTSSSRRNLVTGYGPTDIGCASTGCVMADYNRLWNQNGWMQVRQIYYGGLSTTQPTSVATPGDKIHEFTFFRKHYPLDDTLLTTPNLVGDTAKWVTVVQDSMVLTATQVNTYQKISPFAFQVHGGSRYVYASNGGKGSWYRDIKVRELDSLGRPTYITTSVRGNQKTHYDMKVVSGFLVGSMKLDHIVTVTNLKGSVLQEYVGFAGSDLKRELPRRNEVMVVRIKTSQGTYTLRANPLAQ